MRIGRMNQQRARLVGPVLNLGPPQEKAGPIYRKPEQEVYSLFKIADTELKTPGIAPVPDPIPIIPIPFKIYTTLSVLPHLEGTGIWAIQNDESFVIGNDKFNNIYLSGYYFPIYKYDSNGLALWNTSGSNSGTSIITDNENNIYLTGVYYGELILYNKDGSEFTTLPNSGSSDCFLVKYNGEGNGVWATRIAGTSTDISFSIVTDSDNNVYVTGYYASAFLTIYNKDGSEFTALPNSGSLDCFLVKYNGEGNCLWATRIAGTSLDLGFSVVTDSDNNVYVTGGYTSNTLTVYNEDGSEFTTLSNLGIPIGFLIKYNSAGYGVFSVSYKPTDGLGFVYIRSVFNSVYLSGTYGGSITFYNQDGSEFTSLGTSESTNIFVVKYGVEGTGVWASSISGVGYKENYALVADLDESIYLSGSFAGAEVTFYNRDGSEFKTLIKSVDSYNNGFVVKYNKEGVGVSVIWLESQEVYPWGISVDGENNLYIVGGYYDGVLILHNRDGSEFKRLAMSETEGFLAKYSGN